jgi:hypothetical protein
MHVHVSALNFLIFLAYLILALALINGVAWKWGDKPVGQAAGVLQLG